MSSPDTAPTDGRYLSLLSRTSASGGDRQMKAVSVHRGEARPRVVNVPCPDPTPGEALVRTLRVGIDGTDYEVIDGNHGGYPEGDDFQILGHEAVGVVEDPNGTAFEVGDLVVPTVRRPPNGSNAYFARGEPDMAPAGAYVERGIAGAHGFMAEYFTSPAAFLIPVPESFASHGFLVEPASNSVKAIEHAFASRSAFEWNPESALVLGNGSLGLLTLAMLQADFDRTYCLGRRDRPDSTIDIIEGLDATYVDSRKTPVPEIPATYESMDFVYEATGYAPHAFETIATLAPNGVGALLGIPDEAEFEINGGRLHRELVLENKALVGSVNSNVEHFRTAREALATVPEWFLDDLLTDVHSPEAVDCVFETDEETIKSVVEFGSV